MTQDELHILMKQVEDIHAVLLGVPGTDAKGLCGEVLRLREGQKEHDRRIQAVEATCANHHADQNGLGLDGKLLKRWLIVAAGMGAFVAGALVAMGDKFNLW
jgi:hypothetical protein